MQQLMQTLNANVIFIITGMELHVHLEVQHVNKGLEVLLLNFQVVILMPIIAFDCITNSAIDANFQCNFNTHYY
jgi:hypothetical protein